MENDPKSDPVSEAADKIFKGMDEHFDKVTRVGVRDHKEEKKDLKKAEEKIADNEETLDELDRE